MSWFLVILLLSFTLHSLSEAKTEKKLPSTVVVGTVYCDTCFEAEISKNSHFIPGASVAVECRDGNSSPSFRKEVRTNRHGKFTVHLPFLVSKHAKKIEGCSVKLIRSSEPYCSVASTATSSSLHLKARKQGAHVFSAGFFTFKPQKQPDLCNQKPRIQNAKQFSSRKTLIPPSLDPSFPPPLQDPTSPNVPIIPGMPNLPNLPTLPPLPQLPPLPPLLPGVPVMPPLSGKTKELKTTKSLRTNEFTDKKSVHPENFLPVPELPPLPQIPGIPTLPPNPLLPPSTPGLLPPNPLIPPSTPGFLPPNPLLPPPPSGILPPVPFLPPPLLPPNPVLPPPAPLIPLPPVPGFTPPSPPQPTFPIPLPPGFPGIPPAFSSKKSTP